MSALEGTNYQASKEDADKKMFSEIPQKNIDSDKISEHVRPDVQCFKDALRVTLAQNQEYENYCKALEKYVTPQEMEDAYQESIKKTN